MEKKVIKFPKQCAVYWFDPEPVRGSEIRKIRPCIVISPDEMNEHLQTVIIVPLTSTVTSWPFRFTISLLGQTSSVACDQMRSIDKVRLKDHITDLKTSDRIKIFATIQSILSE